MRRLPMSLLVAGLLLSMAPAAHAAKPDITPGAWFEAEIPFPDICPDFGMTATVAGKPHLIWFVDASGAPIRGFSGGRLSVTWTRDDTGAARTFAIAGPTFFAGDGSTIRGTGRWAAPLADGTWVIASGTLVFSTDTHDGFAILASYSGTARPLCDLMA